MSSPEPDPVTRRLDQIERGSLRVRPTDLGMWRVALPIGPSPSDAVLIAPVDLAWLIEGLRSRETADSEVTYEVYLRYPDDQDVWHLKAPGIETQQEAEEYIDAMKGRRPRYTDSQWRIVRVVREVVA